MVENQKRWWDPIAGISLFLLVFFTAYSLELTYWTFDLNRITSIALLGTIFGFLIGQSVFNRTFTFLLSSLFGVEIFLWQFIFSLSDETAWLARFELAAKRFQSAVSQVLRNVPLDDGILFLAIMAVVFTVLSISIGYLFTRKGKAYIPLSIMTIIFITIQYFVPAGKRNSLIFFLYSMLLVLYLGRMHYLTNRMKWETLEFQKDKSTSGYFLRAIIVLSLVFSTIVWGIQFLSEKLSYFNNQADFHSRRNYSNSNERISNILYPLRSMKVQFGDGMFAETISLGTSRSLDDSLVFKVEPPDENNYLGRYYWKARTFSQYEDGHWRNDDLEFAQFDSVDINVYPELSENLLPYTFTYEVSKKELVTPQITVDIDRNVEVAYFPIDEISRDVIDFVDYEIIRAGDQIKVVGGFYEFDINTHTSESLVYPEWIKHRYLSLPDGLSEKFVTMAEEITHGKFSTFDKVMAVTNYLRSTYTYKDKIEIPQDEEPIEWFMFNGQEGFCNYFATAEVLMLRSNGIPARFVVGYAQGELAGNGYGFSVRKKDSHSWVEVFFPDVGWIIFEPTPSQPGLVYFEENFSDMQLNRRDSVYLERLFSEDLIEKEAYLEWNQAYTEDKELEDEVVVENQSKWVFWFYPISILLLLYFSIHKLVITREKIIRLPMRMARNIEKRHKKVPNWIKRWAVYEGLSLIEKQYKNITNATDIFRLIEKSNQTPKEYFDALAAVILNEREIIADFSSAYHQSLFSEAKSEHEDEVRQAYRGLIKAIFLKKLDGIKEYFKTRLKRLKSR